MIILLMLVLCSVYIELDIIASPHEILMNFLIQLQPNVSQQIHKFQITGAINIINDILK